MVRMTITGKLWRWQLDCKTAEWWIKQSYIFQNQFSINFPKSIFQSNQLISSLNVKANWIEILLFRPIEVGESKDRLIERRRLSQWDMVIILLVVAENLLRSVVEVYHGKRVEVAPVVQAVWWDFGAAGQLHLVDSRVARLTSYFSPLGPAFLLSAVPGRGNLEEMGKEAPGSYHLDIIAFVMFFDSNRRHLPELVHQGSVRPLLAAFLIHVLIICKDHTWFEELNHRRHHYHQHCDHQEPHHHNLMVFMSFKDDITNNIFLQTTHLNIIIIMIKWTNIKTQFPHTNS